MTARAHRRDQKGLALLDVLLGMAIFALIAVIAVQASGKFRERAYVTQAASDAKQLGGGLEAAHIKDTKYPDTVTANASNIAGVNLTRGSKIAGYTVSGNNFRACILSGPTTTSTTAYAIYDSSRGSITSAGNGADATACNGTGVDAPPAGPVDASVPSNVSAVAIAGESKVSIAWTAPSGATAYKVYLDGGATPAWTGTATNAELPGLPPGTHEVTVSAVTGAAESPKSAPITFTIVGDNDFIRFAHPIDLAATSAPWTSVDYNNALATTETGEMSGSTRSVWWSLTVPRDASYTVRPIAPTSGPAFTQTKVRVWKSSATDVNALGAPAIDVLDADAVIDGRVGEKYLIQVVDPCNCPGYSGPFRLRVTPGPANDSLSEAAVIPPVMAAATTWFSPDTNNVFAGMQADEPGGRNSVWWTFTPTRTGTYAFAPVGPSTGGGAPTMPSVSAWQTSTTNMATLAASGSIASAYDGISVNATAGLTYKIRVHDPCGCAGWTGPMRMRVTAS